MYITSTLSFQSLKRDKDHILAWVNTPTSGPDGQGHLPATLKHLEAASRHLLGINNVSNRVCMYYEVRAGPAVISCINEGQRKIRRVRQFLAT